MKKVLLVVLILSFFMVPALFAQTRDLGAFNLVLNDGFEHGNSYGNQISARNLMNGRQIAAGQSYTIKATFTVSRNLEDELMFVLLDPSEAAGWWRELSPYWTTNDANMGLLRTGQTYTVEFTLVTTAAATSAAANRNVLNVFTEGAGTRGRAGSGVQGPVTIRFSAFTITQNN
ncbi:MAG: hypothetical protein FWD47_06045 [Treponema sp.]|nr:hypothetical protein [Treponema sp.]